MNIYQPHRMKIVSVLDETADTRTLRLKFADDRTAADFRFQAGQFAEYSVFGAGEATFCIASPPTRGEYVECTFKSVGKVTRALHALDVGDEIGLRGPYGNRFPLELMENANIVFIAGGIGLAPVRCVIWNVLDERAKYKELTIVYGARTVSDLVYKHELAEWSARGDVRVCQTVDPGGETPDWKGDIGFVPAIVEKAAPPAENSFAIVCGPPVMIKFTLPVLEKLGFRSDRIYTTLENRMKCGLGKCGRCNVGPVYVCKDGPVFTAEQLAGLPNDF